MADKFDQKHIANLLDKSAKLAMSLNHEYVTLEHICLILIEIEYVLPLSVNVAEG